MKPKVKTFFERCYGINTARGFLGVLCDIKERAEADDRNGVVAAVEADIERLINWINFEEGNS